MTDTKSLIAISRLSAEIELKLIESEGLITEEIESMIAVSANMPAKVDSYHEVIEKFIDTSERLKNKAKKYEAAAKRYSAIVDHLKENIRQVLREQGLPRLSGNEIHFRFVRGNPAVKILDATKLPGKYLITKTETNVDKALLASDLKNKIIVEGAELEETFTLRQFENDLSKEKK